jgi:hypothetical protein
MDNSTDPARLISASNAYQDDPSKIHDLGSAAWAFGRAHEMARRKYRIGDDERLALALEDLAAAHAEVRDAARALGAQARTERGRVERLRAGISRVVGVRLDSLGARTDEVIERLEQWAKSKEDGS